MAVERDYYAVLSIERAANGDEIKRAYRRMAMKWHPDRNPGDPKAESEFKACAEAYEVLSDPERKGLYDTHGHAGLRQTPGHDFSRMRPDDIFSIFNDIFGGGIGGGLGGGGRTRRGPLRGYDLETTVEIKLQDVLTGTEVEVAFARRDVCDGCTGTGARAGTKPIKCPTCQGNGQVAQTGLGGMFRMVTTCPNCRGRGMVIAEPCSECRGTARVAKRRALTVKVPPGIADGQVIRIGGEGEPPPPEADAAGKGPRGDLHVAVQVQDHERFERVEDDLIVSREISYALAALGGSTTIDTLDGTTRLEVPRGTQHGDILTIDEAGLPHLRSPESRGDMRVGITIRVPKKVTPEQRELFERLARTELNEGEEYRPAGKGVWKKIKDTIAGS
ncbi:MAG: molecular chaperone DnaJ [Phycisphaerales bacterium]|nr:molecular chaperone DnaJ [Phycisphaerales bacterium]